MRAVWGIKNLAMVLPLLALIELVPAQAPPASPAQAPSNAPVLGAKKVAVSIMVIEASTVKGSFPATLDDKIIKAMPGYASAVLVDELKADVEEGASVSLEVKSSSGPKAGRVLKVTVNEIKPDKTVKMRIGIEALKFATDTEHQKGGRLVIGHRLSAEKALFLAVTPTVTP